MSAEPQDTAAFYRPNGTWSCTRDHRTEPCGECGACKEIAAQNAARRTLRCPACRGEAYLCERPHHGTATWAFHCRSFPHHNLFGTSGDGGPPPGWHDFYGARYTNV